MDYAAVWLPCGLQNFFRANGEVEPKLPFPEEGALFERLNKKFTVIDGPKLDETRNMCFAWFQVGPHFLYADSDGFIVTIGEKKLVPLVPQEYWVRRSAKQAAPDPEHDGKEVADWLLTNFQLNLLLEGIWNSAFDPAVFLISDEKRAENTMKSFSMGGLLAELQVTGEVHDVDTAKPLPVEMRRPIFRRAVRLLRNDHLLPLKWNIEATRRHLFSETMTMLHRPERLMQFVSPLGAERDALFTKSSDEQLRGYVMLISAKLPLIDNLGFLIRDCQHALILDSTDDARARGELQVLEDIVASWNGTAEALHRNVDALERSFTSIWQDQLLHETEQVRIEEEALGELQRQQALNKTSRWFDTLIFVVTLGVAFAALYFSVGGATTVKGHTGTVLGIAVGIVAVASVVFWIGPHWVGLILGEFLPQYEQVTRLDELLNLQAEWMDIPLSDTQLYELRRPESASRLRRIGRRVFFTKKMRRWVNLRCPVPGTPSGSVQYFPVGFHRSDQVPRVRVDSPSAIDTYTRIHVDLDFLLPRRRYVVMRRLVQQDYAPVLRRLVGWKNRLFGTYSDSLPRGRVTAQCVLELHKHSPDPGAAPLYFVRELRLIMSSRKELTHDETFMLLQIVGAVLLDPLLPLSAGFGLESGTHRSLLTDRLSPPASKTGITPPPPTLKFPTWTDFAAARESDRPRGWTEVAAASQDGHRHRPVSDQDAYVALEEAHGCCYYCGSLALETRPPNWEESPSTWAPIGRRIGTVKRRAPRSTDGKKAESGLVWCCLWCGTWPDQRVRGALDHGGYHPPRDLAPGS